MFLIICSSGCASWTKGDLARQAGYTVLHVVDWQQSREIASNDDFYELNPVLGKDPSREEVDLYFATSYLFVTGVAHVLPGKWRQVWQYTIIGVEFANVGRNYYLGLRGSW